MSVCLSTVDEAVALMRMGTSNRKVAHTQMNAESSRSHSILSCIVTTRRYNDNGIVSVLRSRLNLVDLAGLPIPHVCAHSDVCLSACR